MKQEEHDRLVKMMVYELNQNSELWKTTVKGELQSVTVRETIPYGKGFQTMMEFKVKYFHCELTLFTLEGQKPRLFLLPFTVTKQGGKKFRLKSDEHFELMKRITDPLERIINLDLKQQQMEDLFDENLPLISKKYPYIA
jgi:hypothetical protein